MVNKKSGGWTVLEKIHKSGIGIFYIVQCDCGRTSEKTEKSVIKGLSPRCVICARKDFKSKYCL